MPLKKSVSILLLYYSEINPLVARVQEIDILNWFLLAEFVKEMIDFDTHNYCEIKVQINICILKL